MSEPGRAHMPMPGYLNDAFGDWLAANAALTEGIIGQRAFDGVMLDVHPLSAVVDVSSDLLMDMGVIEDTRPPQPPPTRRERFRTWRSDLRERAAVRAYEAISGGSFPDGDW